MWEKRKYSGSITKEKLDKGEMFTYQDVICRICTTYIGTGVSIADSDSVFKCPNCETIFR